MGVPWEGVGKGYYTGKHFNFDHLAIRDFKRINLFLDRSKTIVRARALRLHSQDWCGHKKWLSTLLGMW